jgi:hypothetical protein
MKVQIIARAAAIALVLSMNAACAAEVGDGSTPGYLAQQQELRNDPGYNLGTGGAYIGDGSSPNYQATQRALRTMPGFQAGEADAPVSTGSH